MTIQNRVTIDVNGSMSILESRQLLMEVFEVLPVGVWIMDAQGIIIYGNPEGKRIWAGARYVGPDQFGEYRGWWYDSGKLIEAHEWAGARAVQKGETSVNEKIKIQCFDGSLRVILNSAMPIYDEQKKIAGAIIVNDDITDMDAAQQQLVEKNSELESLNNIMVNRELRIAELKEEIQKLRGDSMSNGS